MGLFGSEIAFRQGQAPTYFRPIPDPALFQQCSWIPDPLCFVPTMTSQGLS